MTIDRPLPIDLRLARAYWISRDTLLWQHAHQPGWRFCLHIAAAGGLTLNDLKLDANHARPLSPNPASINLVLNRFPHLAGLGALIIHPEDRQHVPEWLRGQVVIAAYNQQQQLVDATSLQIPGVLDDLYQYDGPLGVIWQGKRPELRLWAPTARSVKLQRFRNSTAIRPTTHPLTLDPTTGVWSITGSPRWKGAFYRYEVEVFVPSTGRLERNIVTDPYSLSLSINSQRSQIIDLDDPQLKPPGWDTLHKPALATPAEIVLYELHVRDFSICDLSVPEAERGTFLAFAQPNSYGMQHLRRLAQAGLTHVHLLPCFDFASVNEQRSAQREPDWAMLTQLPPDSENQQALIAPIRDQDGFNWGYDPWHYSVPEGSYASEPDGAARVREFRTMVLGLAEAGLRVVMDVVYNHTFASGQNTEAVLDQIVPGYYHRLNSDGAVENSTCCANTASEHRMMEKLMIDSLLIWARHYRVDGFRFDLMGHHMVDNLLNVEQTLRALTLKRDGVDGQAIYLYGEGWDFGEVSGGKRGRNASQFHMSGTGIGTFNDRLRDAVRGGGSFSGLHEQGFATGLWTWPNGKTHGDNTTQRKLLLAQSDWIRIGLTGNLADYRLFDHEGHIRSGAQISYHGQPTGYTRNPTEAISYVSAHDNETLFDAVQIKAPSTASSDERVRMNNLALSLVLLGQGVPFLHAGDELLRSKSLDRNSYNSGDWFNQLDYSYVRNGWGNGLPPGWDNQERWPELQPLLARAELRPSQAQILRAREHVEELLRIRRSSTLFRLGSGARVRQQLTFYNTGPQQIPGLIVFALTAQQPDVYQRIVVVCNAQRTPIRYQETVFSGVAFGLHPVQVASSDPQLAAAHYQHNDGCFDVPGLTTAVFVEPQV
jgi:pullulanase-type alpha-1,6-glucosidase